MITIDSQIKLDLLVPNAIMASFHNWLNTHILIENEMYTEVKSRSFITCIRGDKHKILSGSGEIPGS